MKEYPTDNLVPFIAHVELKNNSQKHFINIYKVSDKYIYTLDPLHGKKKYSFDSFQEIWTGYIIKYERKEKVDYSIYSEVKSKEFLKTIFQDKKYDLIVLFIVTTVGTLLGILSSVLFQFYIDDILTKRSISAVSKFSIILIVLSFFQISLESVRSLMLMKFSVSIEKKIVYDFFYHLSNLPIAFFEKRKIGQILSRFDDAETIKNTLSETTVSLIMDSIVVLIVIIFIICESLFISIVPIIAFILTIIIFVSFSKLFSKLYIDIIDQKSQVESYKVEIIKSHEYNKTLNIQSNILSMFKKKYNKMLDSLIKLRKTQIVHDFYNDFIDLNSRNAIIWIGGILIFYAKLSTGQLVSICFLIILFIRPLNRLLNIQAKLNETFVSIARLTDFFDYNNYECDSENLLSSDICNIKIDDLSYFYDNEKYVFKNLNISFNKFDWISISGRSGTGKSTIIKLLLGQYKSYTSKILINNIPISTLNIQEYLKKIGYVPQNPVFISGTIMENIIYYRNDVSENDVYLICKQIGIEDFILDLNSGYNTILSEDAESLSGGEKQKIAIARALVSKPQLLLLDEVTNNLDATSIDKLSSFLLEFKNTGSIIISVSHDEEFLKMGNKLFCFDRQMIYG